LIIGGRLEIREKGVVSRGKLLRWGNIESYEWTEGEQTIRFNVRRLLKAFPPVRISIPLAQREAVDAVLSRYLSDWPGAASGGIPV
jgi:hypothetical protein